MNNYNLIFASDLKPAIGVEPGYTAQDAKLLQVIQKATQDIEAVTGRNFSRNQYIEILDTATNYVVNYDMYGYSTSGYLTYGKLSPIRLKNFPVDETAEFKVYYDPQRRWTDEFLLTEEDYDLNPETGELVLNRNTTACKRSVKVIYTAGYAPTTVDGETALASSLPRDLVQACIWQAQHTYDKSTTNINSEYSGSVGKGDSYRYVNIHGLVPEALAIAVRYKRYRGKAV